MDADKIGEYKVFFIASNPSSLDNEIKYSLSNANGMENLTQVLKIDEEYNSKILQYMSFLLNLFKEN